MVNAVDRKTSFYPVFVVQKHFLHSVAHFPGTTPAKKMKIFDNFCSDDVAVAVLG